MSMSAPVRRTANADDGRAHRYARPRQALG